MYVEEFASEADSLSFSMKSKGKITPCISVVSRIVICCLPALLHPVNEMIISEAAASIFRYFNFILITINYGINIEKNIGLFCIISHFMATLRVK
jgi:hypothetical protein